MKGYIYTMFAGADPGAGWVMTDPMLGKTPTLGACMPNIRRAVVAGDHIFFISGRISGLPQYVVGGFEVSEKIDALAAYSRFPQNRMREEDGGLRGNIVVREDGSKNPIDYHSNFAARVNNYIVGRDLRAIDGAPSVGRAREGTLPLLRKLFARQGATVHAVLGRWRRLDPEQIGEIYQFIRAANRG